MTDKKTPKKSFITDDILWYINAIRKDKRKLTPDIKLELAAELIDAIIELRKEKNNEL